MVLRIRVRSGKLFQDHTSFSRMSSYVVLIGGGNRFRTVTDKNGGKQPVWDESLTFPNNPPNMKLEIWVENSNGDILAGQVMIDLANFYQREPYRIEPKVLSIGLNKQLAAEVKIELDFDFDGMTEDQMKRIKAGGIKPQQPTQTGDLQIGTVIAKGNKKNTYQKPPSADNAFKNHYNTPYEDNKPPTAPQRNDFNDDPWGKPIARKRSVEGNTYNKPEPWNNNAGGKDSWDNNTGKQINNNNEAQNMNRGLAEGLLNIFKNPNKNDGNLKTEPAKNDGWDNLPPTNNGRQKAKGNGWDDVTPLNDKNEPANSNGWDVVVPINSKQKEPAKNYGWDQKGPGTNKQKEPAKDVKKEPWSNQSDPYDMNNGWDL